MRPEWLGMVYQLRVLNDEAGTNLFINADVTNEQVDRQWAIGWTLWAMAQKRTTIKTVPPPDAAIVNVQAFTNNIEFYASYELPQKPVTLLRSWDYRQHRLIAMGCLPLQSVDKALGLLGFRKVIGGFPKEFVRSEEEWQKLREEIIEAAKWGARITPEEESPSYDPLKEAFRRVWLERPNRKTGEQDYYETAFRAYRDVTNGQFFDRDTAQVNLVRQSEKLMESFKSK